MSLAEVAALFKVYSADSRTENPVVGVAVGFNGGPVVETALEAPVGHCATALTAGGMRDGQALGICAGSRGANFEVGRSGDGDVVAQVGTDNGNGLHVRRAHAHQVAEVVDGLRRYGERLVVFQNLGQLELVVVGDSSPG